MMINTASGLYSNAQAIYDNMTPEQRDAAQVLASYLKPQVEAMQQVQGYTPGGIIDFIQQTFYLPETKRPIDLMPFQSIVLRECFEPTRKHTREPINYQTIIYSTVKKSGKTTVTSTVGRWVAECKERWGLRNEIYCLANDEEQARGRVYQKIVDSVRMTPGFQPHGDGGILPNRWRIIQRDATCLSTGSVVKALSSDYAGEAGSNPTATLWSELWAYTSSASMRFWSELRPVPTRPHSFRFIDTYAGFEDESNILWDLWQLALNGRQLTHDDVPDWPYDEPLLPIYVDQTAKIFAFIDTGIVARRMPWQTDEYYQAEAATALSEGDFRRHHLNEWSSSVSSLMPNEWWDACTKPLPVPDINTPIVLGVDAAVSSDYCAVVGISRDPDNYATGTAIHFAEAWSPPHGGKFDYDETIKPYIKELCSKYNVVEVAYDPYQLHHLMTELTKEGVAWCRPFSQNTDRMRADYMLYTMARDRKIRHNGQQVLHDAVAHAAKQQAAKEDTKMRIVKKGAHSKIDPIIAASMANFEVMRLNL
jgi:phage terminase large subunit-like protein